MSSAGITRHLGPAIEVNVKLRFPKAFVDYIKEVAIKHGMAYDIDQYSANTCATMVSNLDGDVDIALKNYRIPKMLAYYEKEIKEYYV